MRIARRRDILAIVIDSVIGTARCRPMERRLAFWALWEAASSGDGDGGELQVEERCVIVLANG